MSIIDEYNKGRGQTRQALLNMNWDMASKAVIASNGGNGCVLFYCGAHITYEIEEDGLNELSGLGLDDAPIGLSVWEGIYHYEPGPYCYEFEGSTMPKGAFRPLQDSEWEALKRNECPWDPRHWLLQEEKDEKEG